MKWILNFLMVLILAISCSSKIASNPLTPPPTPSPDETEQELLLQIDGVGMDWSDAQVKAFVEKICATVDRLRTKYKVSVLTNPISYYKEEGHGQGDPSVGVNRVHPNLLSEFRYFAQKDIDVYLDIYASDNYTAQNGELGNLPLPKRRYGEPETIKGLNMDLDCFEDIFAKYPNVKGVRFHELIGTHDRRNDGHGFAIEFSLLPEIAQMLKDHERRLVWGDQSWDLCYTDAAGHGFWLDHLNEVCDILGSDLTINFNNNGWGAEIQALTFSRNMANYRNGNLWGTSDQAWWWQEVEAQSLPLWEDGSVRWIGWGPMDMAPELLASFALETFRRGGCLVQIEPPATLFEPAPTTSIPNNLKRKQYGPTIAYKVFEDLMLNYTSNASAYPSMDPADYYVLDRGTLLGNRWSGKPKKYDRMTITSIGDKVVDNSLYSSDYTRWIQREDDFSFSWIYGGDIVDASRIRLEFHAIDERMLVKRTANGLEVEFYDHMGNQYVNCNNVAGETADGEMVGIAAMNLQKKGVGQADPDEIVTARSDGATVRFTVYEKVASSSTVGYENFSYEVEPVLTARLNDMLGMVPADDFLFVTGLRTKYVLYVDNTREIDNLAVALRKGDGTIELRGIFQGTLQPTLVSKTVDLDPDQVLDMKGNDCTGDYIDDLAFLMKDNSVRIYTCDFGGDQQFEYLRSIPDCGKNSRKILATRWTTYYKNE